MKKAVDFGEMGALLNKMEKVTDKQLKHQQRVDQNKAKGNKLDTDKERLNQIANLQAF